MNDFNAYWDQIIKLAMDYAPKFLLAIFTLIIGLWIIKLIIKSLDKVMNRANVDDSLRKFFRSLLSILLKVILLISVASMVGIELTSLIAVLGAAGLAVGLALQGSLSNFAGGVLILLFRPFRVGDFIDAQGNLGKVESIQVFNTILKTPDNKTIIIPNGPLAGGSITNFSTEAKRRVDMTFGIGYSDDLKKAKEVLKKLINDDNRVLKEPEPVIAVNELGDNSVNFVVRAWCNSADYWSIYFDMQENVKLEFDKEGISIPFPQRDVHIYQEN